MTDVSADSPAGDLVSALLAAFTQPRRRPITDEELQLLSGARRETVMHHGVALAAWQWGSGAPVLLLHGWESRGSHMAAFVPALLEKGFSAVVLDAPAHGDSLGGQTSVVDYGVAVATVAARFGPLSGVIGYSVGSAAALHAYAHGLRVPASVHLCGPSSLKRMVRGAGAAAGLDASGIARFEGLLAERIGVLLGEMDLTTLQHGLAHPALIVHDPEDREVPAGESEALAKAWAGSTLWHVAGLGHRRILRDPEVVARAAGFIAQHASR